MLITFSGIVGSGKSTTAKSLLHRLQAEGYDVVYLRFRFLSWKRVLRDAPSSRKNDRRKNSTSGSFLDLQQRRQPMRRLTFIRCVGYALRMLNFRLLLRVHFRQRIGLCDRYFYDNLAHYQLTGLPERVYLKFLKQLLPKPDFAFMMQARAETIIQRRGHYEPNYIYALTENYNKLTVEFPGLICVSSDMPEQVDALIAQHIGRIPPCHFASLSHSRS